MGEETRILRGIVSDALEIVGEAGAFLRRQAPAAAAALWRARADFIVAALIGAVAAAFGIWRFWNLDFAILSSDFDLWFEADINRVIEANAGRRSEMHYRTSVHPLFSLLVSLPSILMVRLGLDPRSAAAVLVGGGAFIFAAGFYFAARALQLRRLDSIVASALALSTSAAMFWLPVPESYALGGATMLIPLIWLAAARGEHDLVTAPMQSAIALSITVTNWMAGLAAAVIGLGLRRALWVSSIGLLIVVALSVVQGPLFPRGGLLFNFAEEIGYVSAAPSKLGDRLYSLLSEPLLAPTPAATFTNNGKLVLGFGALGGLAFFWIALAGWAALTVLAIEALFRRLLAPKLAAFFLLVLAGQFVLHLAYGAGYFLYALHFAPLLVLLAAAPCLGPRRLWALGLTAITALSSGAHNLAQLERATDLLNASRERLLEHEAGLHERGAVLWAMHQRPDDPWPASIGHFVWATAGAPLEEKGYFESGGSFSPQPGGPGLSLWVYDEAGALEATSDQPVSPRQAFERVAGDLAPSVVFETSHYRARWRRVASNRWLLTASPVGEGRTLALSVRAVGPAAAPIHGIVGDVEGAVRADACWLMRVRQGRVAYVGEDGAEGWRDYAPANLVPRHQSPDGWAAARIAGPPSEGALEAEVVQTCAQGSGSRWPFEGGPRVTPGDLPIAEILADQSAHLLMGFVGQETRPGDPVSYPLQWLRDGGYSLVAMARAGRLDVARDLVTPFAELDFFGGFGSPGISLWALNEVALAARDPALDERLWPHVRRKADFILELLAARLEVRRPFSGPSIVSRPDTDLVARAATNGMINGRMDWQEPILFVNAFAWRGLEDAASFADRVGAPEDAARWRDASRGLRVAWRHAFRVERLANDRTTASLLWPTGIAALDRGLVQRALARAPLAYAQRPDWTYFEVARAHQLLVLGEADAAWTLIDSLMGLSSFPDLGVLWEGRSGAGDAWRDYRAGARAPALMPHYWSAAELMLFAIEGLAFVDERPERTLVIGAGMRPEWLSRPVAVEGVGTRAGPVDWRWDGTALTVFTDDAGIPLQLGTAFPTDTEITRLPRGRS